MAKKCFGIKRSQNNYHGKLKLLISKSLVMMLLDALSMVIYSFENRCN
ncbi:MAG: hypothetical protein AAF298_21690 [Cyanobacteria bacterium P01_A01_bin.40]